MILVLERETTQDEIDGIVAELAALGLESRVLSGAEKPLVHIIAGRTRKARRMLRGNERVQAMVPTSGPRIRRTGRRFYPYHFLNWCALGLVVLGVLVVLAGFLPTGVGEPADPRQPLVDLPIPWYLRAPAVVLRLSPQDARWIGWLMVAAIAVVVMLAPTIARRTGRSGRMISLAIGGAAVVGFIALTVWRML